MNNIKVITTPNEKVIESIIQIGDTTFSVGYVSKEYIVSYINDSNSFVLTYEKNGKILGFCFSSIWDNEKLFSETEGFHNILEEKGILKEDDLSLGTIKTIAVDVKFQKIGIATELFKASENRLKNLNINSLIVPALAIDGIVPMGKILSRFQYKEWFCLEKFWLSLCKNGTNWCVDRKENQCVCDSCYYIKKLQE